jgi:opacity protein-like surface antigen
MDAATRSFALALCLCATGTAAWAEESAGEIVRNQIRGVYLSGAGGINWVQRGDASIFLGGFASTISSSAHFDRDWSANGAIGYAWKSLFRTEIEGSFRRNDLTSISLQPLSPNRIVGDTETWAVMVNVLNDFPVNSWLSPYLGGGVGYARVRLDGTCAPTAGACRYDDDNGGFAYQVIAGVSVRLAGNVQAFADYHYLGVRDLAFDAVAFSDRISSMKFRNHAVFLGIRVAFQKGGPTASSAS